MAKKKDAADETEEQIEKEVEEMKEEVGESVERSKKMVEKTKKAMKRASKQPGKAAQSVKKHTVNKFSLILLGLSLLATLSFVIIPTTIFDVLSFNFDKIFVLRNFVILLLPLPFAFVVIHSLERFRKESFSALIALLLVPLGGKPALAGLTLAIGCPYVSWKAKNIYNKKNTLYTFFHGVGAAITVLALISGAVFVAAFVSQAPIQGAISESLTNQTVELSEDILQGAIGGSFQNVTEKQTELARQLVDFTEATVFRHVRNDGTFSGSQRQVLRNGFGEARRSVEDIIQEQGRQATDIGQEQIGSPIKTQVAGLIDSVVEPTPGVNIALFLIVFSFVLILRWPFALIGTFYAWLLLRLHVFVGDEPQ